MSNDQNWFIAHGMGRERASVLAYLRKYADALDGGRDQAKRDAGQPASSMIRELAEEIRQGKHNT